MSEAVPTLRGSLATAPLSHLLVYGLDRVLTGTLVLEQLGGAKHAIFFDAGGPAKAKTHVPVVHLGEILVEQKVISEELYRSTLATATAERRLHGQVLLEEGSITERKLREALREQLSRQVLWMLGLPGSTLYGYYDRVNFLERWGALGSGIRVHPLSLIWLGLRAHADPVHVAEVIQRFGEQPIYLHADAPIRRFRFEPRLQAVIDVLRAKPQPLAELLERGLGDAESVTRLVYALILLRQVETGLPGVMPIGVDEPPSSSRVVVAAVAPSGSYVTRRSSGSMRLKLDAMAQQPHAVTVVESPEVAAFKTEIRERVERKGESYYGVLGLPNDAPQPLIQSAFFDLAKRWHPDRLGPDLADVRESATRVFSRMSEAHQVLSDPTRRKEYDELNAKGAGSVDDQEKVQRVLRAATAFQKAEVLLKRNNPAGAEEEVMKALEDDPTQADYVALCAWLQASKPGADLEDILSRLNKALRMEDGNVRIRWYRGQILKRLGRENRAISDFRFIAEADPRHTDALREVRLYEMRKSDPRRSSRSSTHPKSTSPVPSEKPKTPDGGLFGKWFKR